MNWLGKTFDLEEKIAEFCETVHPMTLRATLVEDWYHEPDGHIKTTLVEKKGSEIVADRFNRAVRENPHFLKFLLKPKYERHNGEPIPWTIKIGKTFWKRKRFFQAECGASVSFGVGSSAYFFTVRIEEVK